MPNANNLKRSTNKAILIYGEPGSGKSTQFTTLPGRKLAYVFDASGLDSLAGQDIDYETFYPDPLTTGVITSKKRPSDPRARQSEKPVAYNEFEDHLIGMLAHQFKDHDVIGFLSITSMLIGIMDLVQSLDNRLDAPPEIQDYNVVGVTVGRLFRRVLSIPNKIFYLEAHSNMVQDDLTHRIYNELDIGKRQRREIPRLLTDILVAHCEQKDDKAVYSIQTLPSKEFPIAKNSMELDANIPMNIDLSQPREGQGLGKLLTLNN